MRTLFDPRFGCLQLLSGLMQVFLGLINFDGDFRQLVADRLNLRQQLFEVIPVFVNVMLRFLLLPGGFFLHFLASAACRCSCFSSLSIWLIVLAEPSAGWKIKAAKDTTAIVVTHFFNFVSPSFL